MKNPLAAAVLALIALAAGAPVGAQQAGGHDMHAGHGAPAASADTPAARKYVGLSGETDKATRDAVNENMRGEAILNVKKYPKAIFEITSAKATGRLSTRQLPTYVLEGDFTLHGITLPQKILVEVEQVRGWLHIRGSFTINQTAFGITPYSKAFGAIGVADSLKIFGDLYVVPTEHITMTDVPSSQP